MVRTLTALLVVLPLVSGAQVTSGSAHFELERLTLNPSAGASLVTSTGDGLEAGRYRVALLGHYQHEPLVVYRDTGERLGALVGYRFSGELVAAWAPLRMLEVGLHVPVVLSQGGDDLSSLGFASTSGVGLATPTVTARWLGLRQSAGDPLDFSAQVSLGLPFGSVDGFANDGQVSFVPRLGAGARFGWLRVGVELGFEFRRQRQLGTDALGHTLGVAVTASTTGSGLRGELTGRGQFSVAPAGVGAGDVLAGVRYPLGDFELFALGGPGLGSAMGNPVFRVLGGVAWSPRTTPTSTVKP